MFRILIFDKTKPNIHNTGINDQYYCTYFGTQNIELKWDYENNHSIILNHV